MCSGLFPPRSGHCGSPWTPDRPCATGVARGVGVRVQLLEICSVNSLTLLLEPVSSKSTILPSNSDEVVFGGTEYAMSPLPHPELADTISTAVFKDSIRQQHVERLVRTATEPNWSLAVAPHPERRVTGGISRYAHAAGLGVGVGGPAVVGEAGGFGTGHPRAAAATAPMISLIATSPLRSASTAGHWSTAEPDKLIWTVLSSSSILTRPSPSQSPGQVSAIALPQSKAREMVMASAEARRRTLAIVRLASALSRAGRNAPAPVVRPCPRPASAAAPG